MRRLEVRVLPALQGFYGDATVSEHRRVIMLRGKSLGAIMDYYQTPMRCTKSHCEGYFEVGLGFIDEVDYEEQLTIDDIMVILNARRGKRRSLIGDSNCLSYEKQRLASPSN